MGIILNKFQLLLIEDDAPLAELTSEFFNEFEFNCVCVETGEDAIELLKKLKFDLIICDVNLPDIQGFDLLKKLDLPFNFPVLFLTALSDSQSQITGLESGGCDYVVKPVEPELLLARVRAHLRHSYPAGLDDVVKLGDMQMDYVHKQMEFKGNNIKLTNQEFELLWFFVKHGDGIVSREKIFLDLIGRPYDGVDRAADLRISRFRKKMENLRLNELSIDSIRNQGYMFKYWSQFNEAQ